MTRRVVVTADDFGLALPVNEAVERAHRDGILTAASLMVNEAGLDDAVLRARRNPRLRVGLHLTLVHGRPALPPAQIPALVGSDGRFLTDLARAGVTFFAARGVRAQLRAEIAAQFARYAATGLALDHVDAQSHLHLHPTVLGILIDVVRAHGAPPVRLPFEPFGPSWRAGRDRRSLRLANAYALGPWTALMRRRLRRAGIRTADRVFGISDVGRMDRARVLALIDALPPGDTELFFHCATRRWPGIAPELRDYRLEDELAALVDPDVRAAFDARRIARVGYGDLRAG